MSNSAAITAITPSAADILPPAQPVAELLSDLVLDFSRRDVRLPLQDWLADTLARRSGIDRVAALDGARQLLGYLEDSHQLRADLRQHLDRGKSRGSWIARQVEQIARDTQANPAEVAALGELLAGQAPAEGVKLPDWNEMSRLALAQGIERQSRLQAASGVVEDGTRPSLGQVASGWLKAQPESERLAQRFIKGELDLSSRVGLQATLAAGAQIATRQGLLGPEMKRALDGGALIPAWFAHQTFVGTENASVLHAAGSGQLDPAQALDRMADVVTVAVTRTMREVCKRVGGQIGQVLALKVPFVGPFLAPVGRKVGELIGTAVGVVAGGVVGQVIRKGGEVMKRVATTLVSGVTKAAKRITNFLFA